MQRFDRVTDTEASETFSRVLLGLSDMTPMLSNDLMSHPTVSKRDLRERVVMARAKAAHPALADVLDHNDPHPGEAAVVTAPVVASDITEHADAIAAIEEVDRLESPVGELALSDINAISGQGWSELDDTGERYAGDSDLAIDEITLDDLGSASLAGLGGAVAADDLQETRAGFVLRNGMKIDFAVTRYTSVDGIDQLHTIANLPEGLNASALSQVTGGTLSNTQVLRPDTGSVFTLVQNDLNNQRIIDVTEIDIGIENFGLRSIDFVPPSLLNDAIPAEIRR